MPAGTSRVPILRLVGGDEGGGGIGSGAPDFAVGDDVGADGAALEAG